MIIINIQNDNTMLGCTENGIYQVEKYFKPIPIMGHD